MRGAPNKPLWSFSDPQGPDTEVAVTGRKSEGDWLQVTRPVGISGSPSDPDAAYRDADSGLAQSTSHLADVVNELLADTAGQISRRAWEYHAWNHSTKRADNAYLFPNIYDRSGRPPARD